MAIDKFVEVNDGKQALTLAKVGAINDFHWVHQNEIGFLRSDAPQQRAPGRFQDADGFVYLPFPLRTDDGKDSWTFKLNKDLYSEAIQRLFDYLVVRRQEEKYRHQLANGVFSTSTA